MCQLYNSPENHQNLVRKYFSPLHSHKAKKCLAHQLRTSKQSVKSGQFFFTVLPKFAGTALGDPRGPLGPPRMFWPFQLSPAGPRVVRLLRGDIASHQAEAIAVSANPHLEGTLRSNFWRFSGRTNADGAVRLAGGRSLAAATAKVSARPPNLGTVELPMR